MEALNAIVSEINGFLWSSVIIILLVGAGFYFTVRTRGVQIRYFTKMFSLITESAGKKPPAMRSPRFRPFVSARHPVSALAILPASPSLSQQVVRVRSSGCGSSPSSAQRQAS